MTLDGTVEMLHSKTDSDYIAPQKKSLSPHQILYHACTAVDVCCVCVCVCGFFFTWCHFHVMFLDLRILGNLRKHQCKARHRGFDEFGYLFLSLINKNNLITEYPDYLSKTLHFCRFQHLSICHRFANFFKWCCKILTYSLLLLWSCYILCNWI